jgi:MFS family permease
MPLTILAWVATPFATHDGEVIAYIALFSFFIAFPRPTIASYLGDLFPSEVRSKAMGLSALIQALIAGITLVSVGKIVKTSVWAGFLFVGIFSVLLVILSMTFLEERRVPAMEATVQGNPLLDVGKNIKTCWKHSPRCFVLMCAGFFWFCASNMLQATVTSFAVAVLKIPPGDTLTFVTIFALAFLLTAVPAGMFTHSSKARFTSILVAHLLMIPLCVCIYLFVKNKMFFLVILFAAGSLSSLIFTNFLPLIYDAAGHGKGSPPGKLRSLTAYEDANNASVAELRAEALRDLDGRSVAAADQQAAAAAEGTPGEELIAKKASGLEAGLEAVDLNVEAKPQKQDSLAVPGAAVVGAGGQQQQPLPPLGRPSAVLDVKPLDSGSLVGLWYICINLGSVIGPVAAGGLVTGTGDFAAVFLLGAGFISASTILLCIAWWVIKTGPKIRH